MNVFWVLLALICLASPVEVHALGGAPVTNEGGVDSASGTETQTDSADQVDEGGTVETESQPGTKKVIDFFSTALEFMESGIYEFADSVLERVAAWFIIWQFELKLTFLDVAATIADTIVDSFDIAGKIEKLLGKVDAKVLAFVVWLRIPEALSMMLSAHIVRFILQLF